MIHLIFGIVIAAAIFGLMLSAHEGSADVSEY